MVKMSGVNRFNLCFLLDTIIPCNKWGNTETNMHLGEVGCQAGRQAGRHTNNVCPSTSSMSECT